MAQGAEAETELVILKVEEKELIEATCLQHEPSLNQHTGADTGWHGLRNLRRARTLRSCATQGHGADEVRFRAIGLNYAALRMEAHPGEDHGCRPLPVQVKQTDNAEWIDVDVVIEQQHEVGCRPPQPRIAGGRQALVLGHLHERDGGKLRSNPLLAAVGRAVVHHQDGRKRALLVLERAQHAQGALTAVVADHDDGDWWGGRE